ncbi:translation initiation factor IF-2 [Fundicoccus culcitae]|uniref:Translation initiation factor IF-2 n=1 Tax=Fundicoccus culcitae TaxID=2969821 RepID=A0ABY5P7B3_9LACT|nr:translation initiation factor IF-2 [Fundicoccus culcitae]UUX34626.1 translation initiation factor IF-2 [Fundicoccus culcitae]
MTAIRVYEFAKNHNMSSKAVLNLAKKNDIDFNSHMSSMTEEQQNKLNQLINNRKPVVEANDSTTNTQATKKDSAKSANPNKEVQHKQRSHSNKKQTEDDIETKTSSNNSKHTDKASKKRSMNNQSEEQEQGNRSNRRRGRGNRNNRNNKNQPVSKGITARKHKDLPEKLVYTEGMNIQEISKIFHRDASEIIKKLLLSGVMANQNQALSKEVIELIALEYGVEPEEKVVVDKADLEIYFEDNEDEELLTSRPPVVTIMGHVDHGKTTLLDQLRHTRVTEGEAGGITQHIGAYQVEIEGKPITFLDTPGHEAFTTMRARGADITDITIIVVAANDGVMPQTIEAINHAKAANVPIIVAINKVDLPEANPDRVMQELSEYGLIPEAWGGDTIFVQISAKYNQNIDELLEMILLVAEVEELTANSNRLAVGTVIEARLDKAQGATATLLVQQGTLRIGDPIVVGNSYGKVRTMLNDNGRRIRSAGPATPVEITGLNDAPQAGDLFVVFEDEKSARMAGEERAQRAQLEQRDTKKKVTLDNLFESLSEGELKSVNVIIKGDVQGSVEALSASLQKIEVSGVRVNIIHQAVGAINESDITLAAASGAIVIGFNVRPTPQARAQATEEEIDIRQHRIIYNAIDEIETAMKGMLDPEFVEEIQGQVVVRETYNVSKVGTIAGAYVLEGHITRNSKVRVIRDNIVRYEGEIASLKRFKDDAREVTKGFECGIMIEKYNDIHVDDIIEAYHMVEVKR